MVQRKVSLTRRDAASLPAPLGATAAPRRLARRTKGRPPGPLARGKRSPVCAFASISSWPRGGEAPGRRPAQPVGVIGSAAHETDGYLSVESGFAATYAVKKSLVSDALVDHSSDDRRLRT